MANRPLVRGRTVIANVTDPQGVNPKDRPLVIISSQEDINAGEVLDVVAISGTAPLEDEPAFALPWSPQGNTQTQCRKACWAWCNWTEQVEQADVLDCWGTVPEALLVQIIEKVIELRSE